MKHDHSLQAAAKSKQSVSGIRIFVVEGEYSDHLNPDKLIVSVFSSIHPQHSEIEYSRIFEIN